MIWGQCKNITFVRGFVKMMTCFDGDLLHSIR